MGKKQLRKDDRPKKQENLSMQEKLLRICPQIEGGENITIFSKDKPVQNAQKFSKDKPAQNVQKSSKDKPAQNVQKSSKDKPAQNTQVSSRHSAQGNQTKNNDHEHKSDTQEKYVGAPYNFVPFSPMVYQYSDEELTGHDELNEELISGEIDYEITAKSPIFIDDGNKENPNFFTNEKGQYAIPGSSVRGLIRNNVQILGLSAIGDDVDDYRLMYRRVADTHGVKSDKKKYDSFFDTDTIAVQIEGKKKNISVLKEVQAGYITKKQGNYLIYKTALDCIESEHGNMNYYVLSERTIIGDYLEKHDKFGYGFFRKEGEKYLKNNYKKFDRSVDKKGNIHYTQKEEKKDYKPYYVKVSYRIQDKHYVTEVLPPGKPGYQHGYAVGTGPMREKKAIYIIPEVDMNKEPIPIPNDDVRSYKIDLENKKNTLNDKGGVEAYALPEEGKMRPVFYIQKGGRLYFGYTPRLRLLYDHSVKEGVPQIHAPKKTEEIKIDFAKAMFGYSNQNGNAYRSKLSFTDAVVRESENVKPGAEQRVILSSPKPTSCLDYICTDDKGNPRSYNANKFELRGVKQYWIRENAVPSDEKKAEQGKVDKVSSVLRPLAEKTVFKGTVRFQNLTQKELGLLLWSIRLNKDSWMNIGKAKAYGYGTVAVQITGARKICISKAYSLDGTLNLKPYEDIDVDAAINHYKIEMNQWLKKEKSSLSIEEQPSVSDFLRMKDSKNIPGDNDIRYMRIGSKKNEYQKRTKTLPSVKEVQEKRSSKKKGD